MFSYVSKLSLKINVISSVTRSSNRSRSISIDWFSICLNLGSMEMAITHLTQIATMILVDAISVQHGIRWWYLSAISFLLSTGSLHPVFFSSRFDNFFICSSSINFLIYCSVGEKFKTIVLRFCRNILATSGRGKKQFRVSSGKPDCTKFH